MINLGLNLIEYSMNYAIFNLYVFLMLFLLNDIRNRRKILKIVKELIREQEEKNE